MMARAPRKYVPKVKGQNECSQRRINCDRAEPECSKCVSKGVARRARSWAQVPEADGSDGRRGGEEHVPEIRLNSVDAVEEKGIVVRDQPVVLEPVLSFREEAIRSTSASLVPSLTHVAPWQRLLLKHFSDHIAPEMVVIDDCNNGWRNLVLPLACADELVMSAVMAVSAFHLSDKAVGVADAGMLYSTAIHELQKRQDLRKYDIPARHRIILAIIVLLLAMIVNGCSDFPIMFRMLQSALDMVGGESMLGAGSQAITEFSARQIRKMRVYASPFISQDAGVTAIATHARQGWPDQHHYRQSYPAHSRALGLISNLREQAFRIYLRRASSAEDVGAASTDLISTFRQMLESFPEELPGEHVLIWPIFIAASESYAPEHREFFAGFLERHFRRNGFANILKALESLRVIWARNGGENWTALLPKQPVFVM
ncbi:hypothetical protein ACJ41O_008894 [Fusarium nematophilum]